MNTLGLDGALPLPEYQQPRVLWIRAFLLTLEQLQRPASGHHSLTFGLVGNDKDGWQEELILTLRPSAQHNGGNIILDPTDLDGTPTAAAKRVSKAVVALANKGAGATERVV